MKRRRRPDKSPTRIAAAIIGGVLIVVLFPLYIPIVGWLVRRDEKRKRTLSEHFACLQCGQVIGAEALPLADALWARHWDTLQREQPEAVYWRIVRTVHAVCPHCGAPYEFQPDTIAFAPTALPPAR